MKKWLGIFIKNEYLCSQVNAGVHRTYSMFVEILKKSPNKMVEVEKFSTSYLITYDNWNLLFLSRDTSVKVSILNIPFCVRITIKCILVTSISIIIVIIIIPKCILLHLTFTLFFLFLDFFFFNGL